MLGFFNKVIDWIKSKFFNKELEIAIVGLQNAGKTTLVKAITDGVYDEDTIPTIGFNHHEIKKGNSCLTQEKSP
jgi:ADP-ribosylation factor-like protein 8